MIVLTLSGPMKSVRDTLVCADMTAPKAARPRPTACATPASARADAPSSSAAPPCAAPTRPSPHRSAAPDTAATPAHRLAESSPPSTRFHAPDVRRNSHPKPPMPSAVLLNDQPIHQDRSCNESPIPQMPLSGGARPRIPSAALIRVSDARTTAPHAGCPYTSQRPTSRPSTGCDRVGPYHGMNQRADAHKRDSSTGIEWPASDQS